MGALAVALVTLTAAAPFVTDDPESIVTAIEHDRGTVSSATYVARPAGSTTAVGGAASTTTQPLDGSTIAYLSNGDATVGWNGTRSQSDTLSHHRGTTARGGHDVIVLSMRIRVPEEANCLTFGASFFSEDYGEAVTDDPRYFDSFLAELDPASPWLAGAGDPSTLDAPANFAKVRMPNGPEPVSALVHSLSFSTQQAYGTGFDGTTQWHTFKAPVTPGEHVLQLSVFDRADGEYDSTALVDDLRLIRRRPDACTLPGRDQFSTGEDLDAPPVTIEARRGWLSGTAGAAESDEPRVSMKVGSRTVSADVRGDGTWSLATGGLEPGTHRVRASQFDAAGNEGRSGEATVTVDAPPPEPEPEPTAVPTASPPPPGPPPPGPPPPGAGPPPSPSFVPGNPARPPAVARCKVPKLRGRSVVAAARALRRAHCRVGRLSRKRARSGKRRRVIKQTPRAGVRRPAGTRVKLTLRR